MNAAEHLTPWARPRYYGGFSPDGDFLILSQHRDSPLLDRCNWEEACKSLKAEAFDGGSAQMADRSAVYHFRASHAAVGWVEYLLVRQDAPHETLERAGEIVCALAEYPVLNEEALGRMELDTACERWEQASLRDRLYMLKRFNLPKFAARRDSLPEDPSGALFRYLLED